MTPDVPAMDDIGEDTWSILERLARALRLNVVDLPATLDAILETVLETVRIAEYAGLILLRRGNFVTQTTLGKPAEVLDALQHDLGVGPCIDAARQQSVLSIDDTRTETRWPVFTARANELGVSSMLCVPLWVDTFCLGTLSLYSTQQAGFDDHALRLTRLYATHAALALADAQRATQLSTALHNRDVIGQAKGILIERHRITSDQAFQWLSLASQAANLKLAAVADHLIETGELLGASAG
jgi:transcriptional regulator with GAF, ATPase, and Fis domain